MSVQSPTTEQACPVRHALTRQPHRAATRRMAAAGFHKVQAGRIDHSLSPRRRARFLAKSSPAATFFVLSRASTKNVLIAPGQATLGLRPTRNVSGMVATLCAQSGVNVVNSVATLC
jgi:hypothetical protein